MITSLRARPPFDKNGESVGGRGVAGDLVKAALDYARAQGLRVVPACSYSAAYVQRHPEYADLVD